MESLQTRYVWNYYSVLCADKLHCCSLMNAVCLFAIAVFYWYQTSALETFCAFRCNNNINNDNNIRNSVHVECEKKIDTSNKRSNWNHLKTTETTWAMYQESTKSRNYKKRKGHIGHCTHTMGSTNVKVQKIFHGKNNIHVAQIVNTGHL
jgi:hypothetical protein